MMANFKFKFKCFNVNCYYFIGWNYIAIHIYNIYHLTSFGIAISFSRHLLKATNQHSVPEIGSLTQNCTITELNFNSYHRLTCHMTVRRRSLAAVHIIAQEHIVMLVVGCVNVISCPCLPTPTYHTMLFIKSMQFFRYEAHHTIQP